MCRSIYTRIISLFTVFLFLLSNVLPVIGANHPLSTLEHNRSTGVGDIDITISLDWDPDKVTDTSKITRGLTRTEMETTVKEYAASVYAMTNGLHRLRNVYIFRNKKSWATADIVYLGSKAGRSNAYISAWNTPVRQITMYTYMLNKGKNIWDNYQGPVLAHESGHYIYGLLDEYREGVSSESYTIAQLKQRKEYYMPATDDDNSQSSIMNDHEDWPNWFSTSESYTGATTSGAVSKQMTAHYRNYGKSIWDTLTSSPTSDPTEIQQFGRKQYEAFVGKEVKKARDLKASETGALSGYDGVLKITWVDSPILGLVLLDPNIPADKWGDIQDAAGDIVKNAPEGSYLQVMSGGNTSISRILLSEANRNTLSEQAGTVARGTPVTLETAIRAALEEVKKYRATLSSYQVSSIYLLAGSNPVMSASLMKELRQYNVALKVLYNDNNTSVAVSKRVARPVPKVVNADDSEITAGTSVYLSQISRETGGSFSMSKTSAEMEASAVKAASESEGDDFAVIAGSSAASILAGGKLDLPFRVGSHDTLMTVAMMVSDQDFPNISPSLTTPDGKKIQVGSLPTGIYLEADQENSAWYFVIDTSLYAGAAGSWTATLSARAAVSRDVAIMAATESNLRLQLDVKQRPGLGNVLEVMLKLDRPVLNAAVRADVYDEDGKLVRTGLKLADDGSNGDLRQNDGVYTIAINDLTPGEYSFLVTADDNNGQAIASDKGTFFSTRGDNLPDEATGPFQRMDQGVFVVTEVQQSGGGWGGSGGGGGCAIGGSGPTDLLLLLTVLFPALYLLWSPRRRRTEV